MPVDTAATVAPRASLIILAYSNPQLLEGCLRSLSGDQSAVSREVIVLLNGASPEMLQFAADDRSGLTILHSPVNLGFAGGCNFAARSARGEYLVLLNDDTEVEAGWLDSLVDLADRHRDAGAIGCRIVFPDGRLQEAGSVIWSDGSTMPIGRGLDPDLPRFRVVREVDFVSACALLIRHSTWRTAGGLCEDYHPAYYEDVDLCMTIRQIGQRVLYAPESTVRHYESSSSDPAFRTFLIRRNQTIFRIKWAAALTEFERAEPESPPSVARADLRARRGHHRVLIVDDRLPDPTVGSGFGRLDEAIDTLAAARYGIDFYPVDRCVTPANRLWRRGVCVIDLELDVHLSQPDLIYDVVILSRPHNFERYAALVRRQQPQAALIYDAEALFHIRLQRQVAFVPDPALADSIRSEAERMRHLESGVRRAADAVICVSREEAEYVEQFPGDAKVFFVPPFVSSARWTVNDFDRRSGAVFVAGWLAGDGSPNVDAICWFVAEVLPLIRRAVPDFHTIVTGAAPPGTVARLGCAWVHVVGHVAELSALYDRARVAVAPVRFGAGVKVKTLEALQYGVPVVATEVGAEGLGVEGSAAVRISDTAAGFADAVVSLVTDRAAWHAARDSILPSLRALDQHGTMGNWERAVEAALLTRRPGSLRARLDRAAGLPER